RLRQAEVGPNQPHRRLSDTALAVHIKAVFAEMKGAYGWPRIWRELAARGIRARPPPSCWQNWTSQNPTAGPTPRTTIPSRRATLKPWNISRSFQNGSAAFRTQK